MDNLNSLVDYMRWLHWECCHAYNAERRLLARPPSWLAALATQTVRPGVQRRENHLLLLHDVANGVLREPVLSSMLMFPRVRAVVCPS